MPLTEIAIRKYVALFNQTGTTTPTVQVLQNTLKDINGTWTRYDEGSYKLTANNSFPTFKTWITPFSEWDGNNTAYLPLYDMNTLQGYYNIYQKSINEIQLDCMTPDGTLTDWGTLTGNTTLHIEISVYNTPLNNILS